MPIFSPCDSGIIFRPGATRILCGNGGDAGGHCSDLCASPRFLPLEQQAAPDRDYPGDGCAGQSWGPADVGPFLRRVTAFQKQQKRSFYNEVRQPALSDSAGSHSTTCGWVWLTGRLSRLAPRQFVLDPMHWLEHLPDVIEAYFVMEGVEQDAERGVLYARQAVDAFHKAYHLGAAQAPLLTLHPGRWEPGPFGVL